MRVGWEPRDALRLCHRRRVPASPGAALLCGKPGAAKARLRQGRRPPQAPSRELSHFFPHLIPSPTMGHRCTGGLKKRKLNSSELKARSGTVPGRPCSVPPSSAAGEPHWRCLGAANTRCLTSVLRVPLQGCRAASCILRAGLASASAPRGCSALGGRLVPPQAVPVHGNLPVPGVYLFPDTLFKKKFI